MTAPKDKGQNFDSSSQVLLWLLGPKIAEKQTQQITAPPTLNWPDDTFILS